MTAFLVVIAVVPFAILLALIALSRGVRDGVPEVSQLRRSAPSPQVEPTAARRPETPIRAAGTNLNGRWTPAVFYDFDEAVEDYINTPNVLDQRDAVKRVVAEGNRLLAALDQ